MCCSCGGGLSIDPDAGSGDETEGSEAEPEPDADAAEEWSEEDAEEAYDAGWDEGFDEGYEAAGAGDSVPGEGPQTDGVIPGEGEIPSDYEFVDYDGPLTMSDDDSIPDLDGEPYNVDGPAEAWSAELGMLAL